MATSTRKWVGWAAFVAWLLLSAPVYEETLSIWGVDVPVWLFSPAVFILGAVYFWGTAPRGRDKSS